jgi:tRNA-Thr(GGU) m(6)t(6)A37 methyltransferase TsaA
MNRIFILAVAVLIMSVSPTQSNGADAEARPDRQFTVYPIGWVRKVEGRTTIVVEKEYQPGLLGLDQFSHVWVIYWFDRNDTPEKRSILHVHPRGNPNNPLRGVFATHSPVRPNLIAISRCKIISIKGNVIEIDDIDAFPDTPVLDLKN